MAVSRYGRWGPMFHNFLFGKCAEKYTYRDNRNAARKMCSQLLNHPSPVGIVNHATTQWNQTKSKHHIFYGHSYTAPTPKEYTLQKLGLVISTAIALHIRDTQFGQLVPPTNPNDEDYDGDETGPYDLDDEATPPPADTTTTNTVQTHPHTDDDGLVSIRGGGTTPTPDSAPSSSATLDWVTSPSNPLASVSNDYDELYDHGPFRLDFCNASDLWAPPTSDLLPASFTYFTRDPMDSRPLTGLTDSWFDLGAFSHDPCPELNTTPVPLA